MVPQAFPPPPECVPHHIVLIPDGNGRWAREHRRPVPEGRLQGARAVEGFLRVCRDWGIQVAIQRRAVAAWLAHVEGKDDEALALMRSSAELESSTEKHPVTPGPIIPSRELVGDLILELHQPGQALQEFETSLLASPNRFHGLYGAAKAAELSGDKEKATSYYTKLVEICSHADSDRPELREARASLTKK